MDRTRRADAGRAHRRERAAGLILALAGLAACRDLTLNPDRVIALEVADPAPKVEETDSLLLVARPLNAAGDVVEGAAVTWAVLDTGRLGFTLDPSGLVRGTTSGSSGRVQAQTENLRSDPVTVTVTPFPDTAAATSFTRVQLSASEVQSAGLIVTVYDRGPQTLVGIAGKPVAYQVIQPAAGSLGFFLTVRDTVPGADPRRVTAPTGPNGQASVVVRRIGDQTPPDSTIVEATAYTARGVAVPGTPVRFVVVFRSS